MQIVYIFLDHYRQLIANSGQEAKCKHLASGLTDQLLVADVLEAWFAQQHQGPDQGANSFCDEHEYVVKLTNHSRRRLASKAFGQRSQNMGFATIGIATQVELPENENDGCGAHPSLEEEIGKPRHDTKAINPYSNPEEHVRADFEERERSAIGIMHAGFASAISNHLIDSGIHARQVNFPAEAGTDDDDRAHRHKHQ